MTPSLNAAAVKLLFLLGIKLGVVVFIVFIVQPVFR